MATLAFTTYKLSTFDVDKAKAGSLVAIVSQDSTAVTLSTTDIGDSFKGVGVCVYQGSNSLSVTIDGDTFYFTESGTPGTSHSNGYKLMMVSIVETVYTAGNAATGTQAGTVTRSSTGSVSVGDTTTAPSTVLIDSLNVRDKFALSALNSIISKMGQDPATLSDAAVSHYCSQAYRYAAYMMASSASARSTFNDQTTATGEASVNELESNTDKLLNNLIVELKRTDVEEKEGSTSTYYKNIKVDQVADIVTAMDKSTTMLDGMNVSIASNLSKVSDYTSKQTDYIKVISDATPTISANILNMATKIDTQATHIESVANYVNTLAIKQDTTNTYLNSIHTALNSISTTLSNNVKALSDLNNTLTLVNKSIAALNTAS